MVTMEASNLTARERSGGSRTDFKNLLFSVFFSGITISVIWLVSWRCPVVKVVTLGKETRSVYLALGADRHFSLVVTGELGTITELYELTREGHMKKISVSGALIEGEPRPIFAFPAGVQVAVLLRLPLSSTERYWLSSSVQEVELSSLGPPGSLVEIAGGYESRVVMMVRNEIDRRREAGLWPTSSRMKPLTRLPA